MIVIRPGVRDRINESLKLALKRSGGVAKAETASGSVLSLSDKFACPECGMSYPEISPRLFSFNSPYGSCPTCQGLGETWFCDPELLIDEELSIDEGAIIPWRNSGYFNRLTDSVAEYYGIDTTVPFRKLPAKQKKIIIHGSGGEDITLKRERHGRTLRYKDTYAGVAGIITEWYKETDSPPVREKLAQFMRTAECPDCGGARLRKEALSILFNEKSIYDVVTMSSGNCLAFFSNLDLTKRERRSGTAS